MKKAYLLLLLHFAIAPTIFSTPVKNDSTRLTIQVISPFNNTDTIYRIIPARGNTYGYEILVKNKVLIRQLNIPGKPGTHGFKKKTDAERVAALVLIKLRQGIMPPTIYDTELKELQIEF
jgi:hypothetical protein